MEKRFTGLMAMLANKPRLVGDEQQEARQLLTELKADLKERCRELHARRDVLNNYEKAFLEPALRHTSAELKVRVNTVPDGKWHSNLYGSRINIAHMLSQLT